MHCEGALLLRIAERREFSEQQVDTRAWTYERTVNGR